MMFFSTKFFFNLTFLIKKCFNFHILIYKFFERKYYVDGILWGVNLLILSNIVNRIEKREKKPEHLL